MTSNNAANISHSQWVNIMEQITDILWMYLLPMTLWCPWEWYQHPGRSRFTRRPIDITRLSHVFASLFPAIAPVLVGGGPEKLLHGDKRPERRAAFTSEAFVEQHTLIIDMQFGATAARRCFMAQLSKPLASWRDMVPYEKTLFAIFGLQYFLDNHKAALRLTDTLNLLCRIRNKQDSGKFYTPAYSLAKSAFRRVIKSSGVQQWLKQHRYVRSGLVWLCAHDLRLTPPNWVWLKGVDRTLFYTLHRANTTKGLIGGANVVAIARAEAEIMCFSLPCPGSYVGEAVEGLRQDILSLGLIWDELRPDHDRKRHILTNWFLIDDIPPCTPAIDSEF